MSHKTLFADAIHTPPGKIGGWVVRNEGEGKGYPA